MKYLKGGGKGEYAAVVGRRGEGSRITVLNVKEIGEGVLTVGRGMGGGGPLEAKQIKGRMEQVKG